MFMQKEYVLAAVRIVSLVLGLFLVCADGSAMSMRDKKIHDLAWPLQGSEVSYHQVSNFRKQVYAQIVLSRQIGTIRFLHG